MSVGQHIFGSLLKLVWDIGKDAYEQRELARMTPEQLELWRAKELAKIHKEAVRLSGPAFASENDLRKWGIERMDLVRRTEVSLRNDRGVRTSQYLLEGMDIRGLDLRNARGLNQQQIERAIGDRTTQLPSYLQFPTAWVDPSPGKKSDT